MPKALIDVGVEVDGKIKCSDGKQECEQFRVLNSDDGTDYICECFGGSILCYIPRPECLEAQAEAEQLIATIEEMNNSESVEANRRLKSDTGNFTSFIPSGSTGGDDNG